MKRYGRARRVVWSPSLPVRPISHLAYKNHISIFRFLLLLLPPTEVIPAKMSLRSFSTTSSSSSSSSPRPFSAPTPRGLVFGSNLPPTPTSTYDHPISYTPLYTPLSPHSKYHNDQRPPLPNRAQSLSSGRLVKLRKKNSSRSVASTVMSTSSAPPQQQGGEAGEHRYGERYCEFH